MTRLALRGVGLTLLSLTLALGGLSACSESTSERPKDGSVLDGKVPPGDGALPGDGKLPPGDGAPDPDSAQPQCAPDLLGVDLDFASGAPDELEARHGDWTFAGGKASVTKPWTLYYLGNVLLHRSAFHAAYAVTVEATVPNETDNDDLAVVFAYRHRDAYFYASLSEKESEQTGGVFYCRRARCAKLKPLGQALNAGQATSLRVLVSGQDYEVFSGATSLVKGSHPALGGGRVGVATRDNKADVSSFKVHLQSCDKSAPSAPPEPKAEMVLQDVKLTWDAAGDDTSVVGYSVYRDGKVLPGMPIRTRFFYDNDLQDGATHAYTVVAHDHGGKASAPSVGATLKITLPTAKTVYIDPENTAAGADGSKAKPLSSWSKVKWVAGQLYLQRRGTVSQETTIGFGANGVTLGAYGHGPRPIIESNAGGNDKIVSGWKKTDVTIRDLFVRAPNAFSLIYFSTGCVNGKIINCRTQGGSYGIRITSGGNKDQKIIGCEVSHTVDDGIFIQDATDFEVADTFIHNVNTAWKPPSTPEGQASGDGLQHSRCDRWHVHHNRIDRSSSGNKFCFISNDGQVQGLFEHNICYAPRVDGTGIYLGYGGSNLVLRYNVISGPSAGLYHHTKNLSVYGNAFIGTLTAITGIIDSPTKVHHNVFVDNRRAIAGAQFEVHNNIFVLTEAKDSAIEVKQYQSFTVDLKSSHNLYAQERAGMFNISFTGYDTLGAYQSGTSEGQSSLVGDPLFVDADAGDFHLKQGSPAIDKGAPGKQSEDPEGVTVPQGAGADIGPFEQ